MMKILILLVYLIPYSCTYSQSKMVVDQNFNVNSFYGKYGMNIISLSELPSNIQVNLNGYLERILGPMSDSLTFSHGQIIDLKKKFTADSITFNYSWIVPKYEVNYILRDLSIGIKSYYLQIQLDEYGQILNSNWPRDQSVGKKEFRNRQNIEMYVLRQAEIRGYSPLEFEVDLKHSRKSDNLSWVIKFPMVTGQNKQGFNVLEIPLNSLNVITEYIIETSKLH